VSVNVKFLTFVLSLSVWPT